MIIHTRTGGERSRDWSDARSKYESWFSTERRKTRSQFLRKRAKYFIDETVTKTALCFWEFIHKWKNCAVSYFFLLSSVFFFFFSKEFKSTIPVTENEAILRGGCLWKMMIFPRMYVETNAIASTKCYSLQGLTMHRDHRLRSSVLSIPLQHFVWTLNLDYEEKGRCRATVLHTNEPTRISFVRFCY